MQKQAATKKRQTPAENASISDLASLLTSLEPEDAARLLKELLTPAELHDVALRFESLKLLSRGRTQREIAAELGISLCKITRGSRVLKDKNSMCHQLFSISKE